MKKFFAVCLSLCLAIALCAVPAFADGDVAQVGGGKTYPTLQQAIDEVSGSGKVTLLKDTAEDITIASGKTIELVLNAKLTNDSGHTIVVKNGGNLTISGSGTVDNITHQRAAIDNEIGGVVVLNGGTFTRSAETGASPTQGGTNTFYTIRNHGTMTINSGVTVNQNGHFSSLVENGFYNGASENPGGGAATMIINGGNFSGGINTIKNDDYGVLTVYNGTFENTTQAALLNWNEATVENGTFESVGPAVLNGGGDDTMDKGTLNLKGGTFTGASGQDAVAAMNGQTSYLNGVDITGGAYSSDVSLMVAAGSSELVKASGDNRYQVGQYTSSTNGVTAATQLNGTNVFFESLNDAVNQKGVTSVNVVANATLTQPVPTGVSVTVMANTTLTASGNLGNVAFQNGAKLVVPDGQTVTINGKQYSAGSYEAKGDGSLAKPETTPSAPADSSTGKTNPKTGVRA